jgi:hypothetical protein
VWQEGQPAEQRSFVRYSADGGTTFAGRARLGQGDAFYELPDGPNRDPQVDVCHAEDGDVAVAVSILRIAPNQREVELDYFPLDGSTPTRNYLQNGPAGGQVPVAPDIACIGQRRLVGAFIDRSTDPAHLKVVIRRFDFCPVHCTPPLFYQFDLGPARASGGLSVAATADRAYVVWARGADVRLKSFSIADDLPATVTPHPAVTILESPRASDLTLGASGDRVVLAYRAANDARVRISDDRGQTFGPRIVYIDGPSEASELLAFPTSVDIRGGRILLGGGEQCCILGNNVTATSHFSPDGGVSWTSRSHSIHGMQLAALVSSGGGPRYLETWDQSRDVYPEPPRHQRLRVRGWALSR